MNVQTVAIMVQQVQEIRALWMQQERLRAQQETAYRKDLEEIKKTFEELAAKLVQQQQKELVCKSTTTSTMSTPLASKEEVQDDQDPTSMEEEDNEEFDDSKPVLYDVYEESESEEEALMITKLLHADIIPTPMLMTSIPAPTTMLTYSSNPFKIMPSNITRKPTKEQPFQEREQHVSRKHSDTQRKPRSNRQGSYMAKLYHEYVGMILFAVLMRWNVHARSGLKLLFYDLRFEDESFQEREFDAGARSSKLAHVHVFHGRSSSPSNPHVHPSSMGSRQAFNRGLTSGIVIKILFLDTIGFNYEMLNSRDDKIHETRPEAYGQGNKDQPTHEWESKREKPIYNNVYTYNNNLDKLKYQDPP